ncbi:hypothetical protein [Haloterrigena salifodinae]|nr:hypothetical protein [Haloterrigena salifodinae]
MMGSIGVAATAALAGCSDTVDKATGGPKFEEGDEQDVMLEASFFGDDWSEDPEEESDDENSSESEYEWGFDPEEVPSKEATFSSSDDSEIVVCSVTILEDGDKAEEEAKNFGEANMVGAEEPDIGDYAVRGEFQKTGLICYSLSNALVLTMAATIQGFSLSPNHNNSMKAAEEIESRLEDL